jgi:hypothetical protein
MIVETSCVNPQELIVEFSVEVVIVKTFEKNV